MLGDAHLVKPMEQRADSTLTEDDDSATDGSNKPPDDGDGAGEGKEGIDVTQDPLVDINKYRFNKKL